MAIQSDLLTTAAAKPGGILRRGVTLLTPFAMMGMLFFYGILPGMIQQLRIATSQPWVLLSPRAWRDAILGASFPAILDWVDNMWKDVKQVLLHEAQGDVLEVGAGSGASLKYYDAQRIKSLTLLEPFPALHESLRESVKQKSLTGKATILPIGIEQRSELEAKGVRPGTYDTVVLDPTSHLEYLQSLLKPGGKLLLFEHIRSTSPFTRAYQTIWTYPVWKFWAAGCCFDRESARWVAELDGWSEVSITRPASEDSADFVPHAVAVYTKA